jgi:hypothetical protein
MKAIISADKTPVRRPNMRRDLRCWKTVAKVLSLISEILGAAGGNTGQWTYNVRTTVTNGLLSNGQGYRWNVQHGGIVFPLVHGLHSMYEVAVPLNTISLHPKTLAEEGWALTVDLVSGFDTRNRDHCVPELQVRVSRLVQFLRLSHLRARECRALNVDHPVVEPGRRRPRLEERPQHQVRRRQLEHRRDAERALTWASRRHRGPALPGAEN